jgi:isopentenyl phosphate kinase
MLIFLKMGGSLITDKDQAHTARLEVIHRLAAEIKSALDLNPGMSLLLAHGSGSFGHHPAKKFGTRDGVNTAQQWLGFLEVWKEADKLNQIVTEILASHALPVISFPPSSMITAKNKSLLNWDMTPIKSALKSGLVPIVYGDVIFDLECGATIFSTEELFVYLSDSLLPEKILIAGIEEGVWQDFPKCSQLVQTMTTGTNLDTMIDLGSSRSIDVTGGMLEKVKLMQTLVSRHAKLEVSIFSGMTPNNVFRSLGGEYLGTKITQH